MGRQQKFLSRLKLHNHLDLAFSSTFLLILLQHIWLFSFAI